MITQLHNIQKARLTTTNKNNLLIMLKQQEKNQLNYRQLREG